MFAPTFPSPLLLRKKIRKETFIIHLTLIHLPLITRRIQISVMFKYERKRKSQKPNNFQKIQNENYVLISEMLTCEEKNPQGNLHHLILRGSLQHGKHHLCVSQTKWKPDSRVHDGRLNPWKEHSHDPWSLITWQIRDGLSTFSYSPSLDF